VRANERAQKFSTIQRQVAELEDYDRKYGFNGKQQK
jgi:hypothetical protein